MKKIKGIMMGMFVLFVGGIVFLEPQQAKAAEVEMEGNIASTGDEIGVGTIVSSNDGPTKTIFVAAAASNYSDGNAHVVGDGVRLRKNPSTSATILELMYRGETVLINYTQSKGTWFYVKRMKTGTWGWVKKSYIFEWD